MCEVIGVVGFAPNCQFLMADVVPPKLALRSGREGRQESADNGPDVRLSHVFLTELRRAGFGKCKGKHGDGLGVSIRFLRQHQLLFG